MPKSRFTLLTLLALGLLLAVVTACGGGASGPTPTPTSVGDAARGAELFAQTCQACHGPGGVGVEGLGKDMTHSEFIAGLSDAELLAFIKQGRPSSDPLNTTGIDMPPKGGNPALTDEQLYDIIAYIRTIHE